MATAIPKAYLASSAIRCRDVETGPNLGVLAVFPGLSGFPNAETLNLTMSYVDVGLIGHRVQTRKGPV